MLLYEQRLQHEGCSPIIGIDEAGRGPLAGPVVAAAVALRTYSFSNRIDDSKKLTPRQRETAFIEIAGKSDYGIGIISEELIDRFNILEATRLAMQEAVRGLFGKLGHVPVLRAHALIDGRIGLRPGFPCTDIIRGDSLSMSIACASIMAKVSRDRIMSEYDAQYPQYGFLKHKGYPTAGHRAAIARHGPCKIHRRSFTGV